MQQVDVCEDGVCRLRDGLRMNHENGEKCYNVYNIYRSLAVQ